MLVPVFKCIEFPTSAPERKRFITDYRKKNGHVATLNFDL